MNRRFEEEGEFSSKLNRRISSTLHTLSGEVKIGQRAPITSLLSLSALCWKQTIVFDTSTVSCLVLRFCMISFLGGCVKDPTVNLLQIKAICWRGRPPRDIPLICLLLAVHCSYSYIRLTREEACGRFNRSESWERGVLVSAQPCMWTSPCICKFHFMRAIWKTWPKLTSSVSLTYPSLTCIWLSNPHTKHSLI